MNGPFITKSEMNGPFITCGADPHPASRTHHSGRPAHAHAGPTRAYQVTRALASAGSARQMATFSDRFGIELVEACGSTETNAAIGARSGSSAAAGWGRSGT